MWEVLRQRDDAFRDFSRQLFDLFRLSRFALVAVVWLTLLPVELAEDVNATFEAHPLRKRLPSLALEDERLLRGKCRLGYPVEQVQPKRRWSNLRMYSSPNRSESFTTTTRPRPYSATATRPACFGFAVADAATTTVAPPFTLQEPAR